MAEKMVSLASQQPGFLGVESAHESVSITVSYWSTLDAIKHWKMNADHLIAQQKGRDVWYQEFKIRISKVERDYGMT